jgi:RimJ/RimL family protein N-acetyltransferase
MDILLRPARSADAKEMARWFTDLVSLATWGGPEVRFPLTEGQLARWIAEGANEKPRICFTAVDGADRPVGHVQFLRDPAIHWARLGRFGIAPELRGTGFGRALFDHAVRHAFTVLDVEHLALAVLPANDRARRLYLRAGFRDEGVMPGPSVAGQPWVATVMGMMRQDWLRQNSAGHAA